MFSQVFQCLPFFLFFLGKTLLSGWCTLQSTAELSFYNPRLSGAFVLFRAAYIFNFAAICGVKSRVAFIRVNTVTGRSLQILLQWNLKNLKRISSPQNMRFNFFTSTQYSGFPPYYGLHYNKCVSMSANFKALGIPNNWKRLISAIIVQVSKCKLR